jgi:four helix bundle protein
MLRIVDVIVSLITEVAPLAEQIGRRDPSLAKQLRTALSSVSLNTAEGSDQLGGRRMSHYAIALGSARESFVALRTAVAWGYLGPIPPHITDAFNQVIGTLVKNVRR